MLPPHGLFPHPSKQLQEIEREDEGSVSGGEKRWRTAVTRNTPGFSGTRHTEMNQPCMTCGSTLSE
ncbi:hypothetical protein INR49_017929 [Caranx melampygus]|nr:hypothetical protein INR49_017929 [Caranx melampygus]